MGGWESLQILENIVIDGEKKFALRSFIERVGLEISITVDFQDILEFIWLNDRSIKLLKVCETVLNNRFCVLSIKEEVNSLFYKKLLKVSERLDLGLAKILGLRTYTGNEESRQLTCRAKTLIHR